MAQDAGRELKTFLGADDDGLRTEQIVEQGDPAGYIIDYADQHEVDLIMIPTHGYGKFRALLLGSVTSKVLHDAKCPVWTSPHAEESDLSAHLECKSIVCALDLSHASGPMLQYASEFAREHNATLRLVHAVQEAQSHLERDFANFLQEAARAELAKLQRKAGADFEVSLEGGSVFARHPHGGASLSRESRADRARQHPSCAGTASYQRIRDYSRFTVPGA